MKIMVVNDDLTSISWGTSLIRNLLRSADFIPFFYVAGLVSMVSSSKFQRLGDLAAGTLVIHRQIQAHDVEMMPDVIARPPAMPLAAEDQVAIINFTQRHQQLTQARQQELANVLQELTGREGQKAVGYLRSIGQWLVGGR